MGDRVAVMRSGLLQQVAEPKELYERPRNLFVAEFIGSPAMNLVVADVERAGRRRLGRVRSASTAARPGGARAPPGSRGLRGPPGRPRDPARGHGGRGACVGETHPDRVISVVCDIREDMGSEVYVHFNVPAEPVTTREVVEALVVEDAEDEEARMAAERARGGGRRLRRPARADDRGARAATARARGRRRAAPLLRSRDRKPDRRHRRPLTARRLTGGAACSAGPRSSLSVGYRGRSRCRRRAPDRGLSATGRRFLRRDRRGYHVAMSVRGPVDECLDEALWRPPDVAECTNVDPPELPEPADRPRRALLCAPPTVVGLNR